MTMANSGKENRPAVAGNVSDEDDEIPMLQDTAQGVPLTIITGFLGAGKSTLLQRILTENHGMRIAVILNEFADSADIEARAINISGDSKSGPESALLELPNGCLCCSIKDQGAAAIEQLMAKRGAFDHILLETTGLADPGPIAGMFWQNEEYATGLGRDIKLDGVITVVDAVFGLQQIKEERAENTINESICQIAAADLIILNKIDVAKPDLVEETTTTLHALNPTASILRTVRAQIDLMRVMRLGAYTPGRREILGESIGHVHGPDCDHDHDHGDEETKTHYALNGISSLTLSGIPPLTSNQIQSLDVWLQSVLWDGVLPTSLSTETGATLEVLRSKALLVTTTQEVFVLQGVRNLYELEKSPEPAGSHQTGKIVLIGRGLDVAVRSSLESIWLS